VMELLPVLLGLTALLEPTDGLWAPAGQPGECSPGPTPSSAPFATSDSTADLAFSSAWWFTPVPSSGEG
jgi:hypothetical protein